MSLKHSDIFNNSANSNREWQNPWLTISAAYTFRSIYLNTCKFDLIIKQDINFNVFFLLKHQYIFVLLDKWYSKLLNQII